MIKWKIIHLTVYPFLPFWYILKMI
jgi:hypothetical protein